MYSILSLFVVLTCLFGSLNAQTCDGSYQMTLYAVESPNTGSSDTTQLLTFPIEQSSADIPSFELPASYKYSMIDLKIQQLAAQPNSQFSITLNGQQSRRSYRYQTNGNMIKLAPFLSQGTGRSVNEISISFTDYNEDGSIRCTSTNEFHVINPASLY